MDAARLVVLRGAVHFGQRYADPVKGNQVNFRKALNPNCLGADDFVDAHFNPIDRALTIKRAFQAKPPAGGKEKLCLEFHEDTRCAFFANTQIKKLATMIRRADTDDWIGVQLVVSSAPTKFAGQPTTGMVIKSAKLPQGKGPAKPEVTPDKAQMWANAKAAYLRDGDLDSVLEKATMSEENIARLVAECQA